jgi:hypothetical protein
MFYNSQQQIQGLYINDHMRWLYLKNAISHVKALRDVNHCGMDRHVMGCPGFSYDNILSIDVKLAITNIDEHHSTNLTCDIKMLIDSPPNKEVAILE